MRESFSELFPPRRIGRYQIVERLGAGGMAEVLLAVRQGAVGFKKAVALKRILPQYAKESQFAQMLAREAAIAAMLHHPNCVQVTELEEERGELFMAMELLFGLTVEELGDLLKRRGMPLPLGAVVRIAADAAKALHYVHGLRDESGLPLGVVHRDVSPQNLFVTEDGITKVLDFGIATAVEVLDGDTRTGALKGKYAYMAPEQVNFQALDGRTDVWGLAVTIWGMLVGRPLFRDAGLLETLESIRAGTIRPPSVFRTDVPRALDDVLMAGLQRAAERRTPSAGSFATALEGVAAEIPASSPSDVSALVRTVGADRIEQLRMRAATAVRVSEQIADASGAFRPPELRPVPINRRPDTLPEPNDAGLVATAFAHPAQQAADLRAARDDKPSITAVDRPARSALGPPTLREPQPAAMVPPSSFDGAALAAPIEARIEDAPARETLTTPSTPIALALVNAMQSETRERERLRISEPVESTDPVVRPSSEPVASPLGATVVPAVAVARSATPSQRAITAARIGTSPGTGLPPSALTTTLGDRRGARATRHPWWLDVVAIAVGIGVAWAVAEIVLRR